jgi:hypothetical protein
MSNHQFLLRLCGKSGYLAVRCPALPEENRGSLVWLDPGSGHRMDGELLWRKMKPAAKRLT